MLEKEIKILWIDQEKLIEKLKDLWAVQTYEWYVQDTYFDFDENKMEENKRIFRIREKNDCTLYTIKKKEKWKNLKVCQELECNITDPNWFKKTLEKYWMQATRWKKKYRISYSLDWVEFDIDKYEDIPAFLEIEATDKKTVDKRIDKLALQSNVKKNFWSRWLFEYYWIAYNILSNDK